MHILNQICVRLSVTNAERKREKEKKSSLLSHHKPLPTLYPTFLFGERRDHGKKHNDE